MYPASGSTCGNTTGSIGFRALPKQYHLRLPSGHTDFSLGSLSLPKFPQLLPKPTRNLQHILYDLRLAYFHLSHSLEQHTTHYQQTNQPNKQHINPACLAKDPPAAAPLPRALPSLPARTRPRPPSSRAGPPPRTPRPHTRLLTRPLPLLLLPPRALACSGRWLLPLRTFCCVPFTHPTPPPPPK